MPEDASKYMKPPEAAAYLRVSTSSLAKKRVNGDGPKFVRWGKAIRYRRDDLDAYMAARLVRSTSERPSSAVEASAARSRLKGDER
jgi:predicted DNA-binding transcriptional regulator AlpA